MSPRNDACSHPNCYGLPCKQLTDEELTPEPEDFAVVEQLIAEGYVQVSAKFRTLARVPPDYPTAADLIRPEMLDTPCGRELAKRWTDHVACTVPRSPDGESRVLTVKQFQAYRLVIRGLRGW